MNKINNGIASELDNTADSASNEQEAEEVKLWTTKCFGPDNIPYPYNVNQSGIDIHLYQLNLKYKIDEDIFTSGKKYKDAIEMYLKLIINLFNLESIFWIPEAEKNMKSQFVSIHTTRKIIEKQIFASKGKLDFPDFSMNKENNPDWKDYNDLWHTIWPESLSPTNYSKENEFHFALTELPIRDAENIQGALYCFLTENPKKIPGKNAILSLDPEISDPKGESNPIVNSVGFLDKELFIYNFFRISVFLIRNIIRSLLGFEFYKLHTETKDSECITYNPGNSAAETYEWIMKDLKFAFCEDCTKIINDNLDKYNDINYHDFVKNTLNHLENVCHVLKNKRDLFIKKDYSLFTKLKTF